MARVIHFEIPMTDPEKGVEFYKTVFGWNFQQWGTEQYWLAFTGDKAKPGIDGAIIKRKAPDHPVVNTIEVENLEETQKMIERNGGQIVVPKMAIPTVGWLFYFKDPDGNITGCMQSDAGAK